MIRKISLTLLVFAFLASCKPAIEKERDEIKNAEAALWADSTKTPDRKKAEEVIGKYVTFADKYKDDPMTTEYLFKAGDIAQGINDSRKAIELYAKVCMQKNYSKIPIALFLQGFIFENQLNDTASARIIYEEFLQKYPNHEMAKDAKYSLQNLGKSADELVKSFEQQSKPDTTAMK